MAPTHEPPQIRSIGRQYEDQQSAFYFNAAGSGALQTATFPQESGQHKNEDSIADSTTKNNANATVGGDNDSAARMDLSFMQKKLSLNSQFELKTPQEGGLTKAINSFSTSRLPGQGQNFAF